MITFWFSSSFFWARTNAANVVTNVFYSFRQVITLKINTGLCAGTRTQTQPKRERVKWKLNQKPQFARAHIHKPLTRSRAYTIYNTHINNINYRQLVHIYLDAARRFIDSCYESYICYYYFSKLIELISNKKKMKHEW